MFLFEPIQPIIDGFGEECSQLAEFFRKMPGATVRDALDIQGHGIDDESDFGEDEELNKQYERLETYLFIRLRAIGKRRHLDYPGIQVITLETTSKNYTGPGWWLRRTLEDVLKNIIPMYTRPLAVYMDHGWENCTLEEDYQDVADYGENFPVGSILCMRNRSIPDTPEARTAIRKLLGMRDKSGALSRSGTRRFRHIDIVGNPVSKLDFVQSLTDDERDGLIYLPIDFVTTTDTNHIAYYELEYELKHSVPEI